MSTFLQALKAWKQGKIVYRKDDRRTKWYLGVRCKEDAVDPTYFGMTQRKGTNDVRGCMFQEDIFATDWVIEK